MQELKVRVIDSDMDTPQCSGVPDQDPPESLKPYFMSLSFGVVKVCKWHAQRLTAEESRILDAFRTAFGDGLVSIQKAFLQVHCW
jgi:hypothetical protein